MMMQTKKRMRQDCGRGKLVSATRSCASRVSFAVGLLVLGGALLGVPGSAHAQTALHEITWAHGSPNQVVRFVVFISATTGDRAGARQINVGKPASPRIEDGNSVYSAIISADLSEYVAVAAVSLDGSLSPLSEWSGLPPSTPGRPFYIP
jgi:hypothetical protein